MSKIEEWIKLQESKGYTDKQLEQYLISQGYNKEEVDRLILGTKLGTIIPASNSNKSKFGNNILLWLGLFVVIIAVIGGIYYFTLPKNYDNNIINNSVNNSVNSDITSEESNLTAPVESPIVNTSPIVNISAPIAPIVNATPATFCGDGIRNGDEECDGTDFGRTYCWDFTAPNGNAFNGGALRCTPDCKINLSSCGYCGDGIVSTGSGERCEGSLGVVSFVKNDVRFEWDVSRTNPCKNFGYATGNVLCNTNNCTWNIGGCHAKINATCGNGILEDGEDCDYNIIGRANETTCNVFSHLDTCLNNVTNVSTSCYLNYTGGVLACTQDCMHDFSDCR